MKRCKKKQNCKIPRWRKSSEVNSEQRGVLYRSSRRRKGFPAKFPKFRELTGASQKGSNTPLL